MKLRPLFPEVDAKRTICAPAQRLRQFWVGIAHVEVLIQQGGHRVLCHLLAGQGATVYLGERIVQGATVAERLVDGRIEAVEEPELERIRALEQELQVAEGQLDVRLMAARLRRQSLLYGQAGITGEALLPACQFQEEGRRLPV